MALWAVAGFFGVRVLFAASPRRYLAFKLCGGAWLAWFGPRLLVQHSLRGQPASRRAPAGGLASRPFRLGLLMKFAHPKARLFGSSRFAATLPPHPQPVLGPAAAGVMGARNSANCFEPSDVSIPYPSPFCHHQYPLPSTQRTRHGGLLRRRVA